MIRVLVVDDHALVRAGIAQLLQGEDGIEVVGQAEGGAAALAAVDAAPPDVVLLDLSMPAGDGHTALRDLTRRHPDVRVVVLTSSGARSDILASLEAGAIGYLVKDAPPQDLVNGVRAAASGEAPVSPVAAVEVLRSWRRGRSEPRLTARAREVLILLAEGHSNKVIAHRLGIAEKTVKAHVTQVFMELGVTDRTQAALWVSRNGVPGRSQRG